MGTYGYISIIAMVCYGFMLLMFLTAKRNKIVNSFLVVLVGLLFWAGGSAFMRVHLWPSYEFWYQVSLLGILLLPYAYYCFIPVSYTHLDVDKRQLLMSPPILFIMILKNSEVGALSSPPEPLSLTLPSSSVP